MVVQVARCGNQIAAAGAERAPDRLCREPEPAQDLGTVLPMTRPATGPCFGRAELLELNQERDLLGVGAAALIPTEPRHGIVGHGGQVAAIPFAAVVAPAILFPASRKVARVTRGRSRLFGVSPGATLAEWQ